MKALKMNKWHSLAMAAALCCGAFSGLAHAADAMDAPAQNSAAAGRMAAPVQPVTLQEYLRIVVQNQPNLAADRMQLDLARADSKTAATISNPAMHYSSKRGEKEWGVEQAIPIFGQRGMRIERFIEKQAVAFRSSRKHPHVAVAPHCPGQPRLSPILRKQRLKGDGERIVGSVRNRVSCHN